GTGLKICLLTTCISNNGYDKSPNYPITTNTNNNNTNQPPNPPTWLEPATTNIDTYDFHIQVFPMTDAENDSHIATDFELWDVSANQRVWSSLYNTVTRSHIHKGDGTFEGNLAGADHLLYDHEYRLRARFYENATVNNVSDWSVWRTFHTIIEPANSTSNLTWTPREGYAIQLVAKDINVPVNIQMAPNMYNNLPTPQQPLLYVTQLYGQIGVILKNGTYKEYATNLLNYPSFGNLPGSGETGVDGLYVDQNTGDLFVSMVYQDNSSSTGFLGKVVHFYTNAAGDSFTNATTILNGIPVSPSHHVHTITRGPDGKLYMGTGDADDVTGAQDINKLNGKILRFNDDGSIPSDNPIPGNYVYARGFRNPFGHAWRPGTNELFTTNNGPDSDDGIYKVSKGSVFGWCCNTSAGTWHLWPDTVAPVQIAFDRGNSGFPVESNGSLYVALSGSTYSPDPSSISKRIVQIKINADGTEGQYLDLVTYTGNGFSAPIGLAFGTDGLYFTDIYGESGFVGVGKTKGNIYKIVVGNVSTIPPPENFTAGLGNKQWYPQGLHMIWVCKGIGGSGSYRYDFYFGDGNQQVDYTSDNVYHIYPATGTYTANCTVHDLITGKTADASTNITF
ncbi:hypothetical protein C4573_01670, partial [Candidatus Woesearchaeota archaeon]